MDRVLDPDVLVICDDEGPTSIAGVMGGERSEVRPTTSRVLMEAANWNGPNLLRTSNKLQLRTEASGRFEKGLAPEQALDGQIVATKLMLELTGARLADGTIDVGGAGPEPATIRIRDARTERLLGAAVPRAEAAAILERLQFGVAQAEDGLDVTVPGFRRNDVTREADLIEEVARIWGLREAPRHAALAPRGERAAGAGAAVAAADRGRARRRRRLRGGRLELRRARAGRPAAAARTAIRAARRSALRNPMSEDQSVLRTTLLGSLLDSARANRSRGTTDVRLFEAGAVYFDRPRPDEPRGTLPDERQHLAALLTGALRPATWREPEPPRADFYAAKAVLAAALHAIRVPWSVEPAREPFLHPGRAARILAGGEPAGWIGELHPGVAGAWDLEAVAAFELDLGVVLAAAPEVPGYEDVTSFPSVRQDRAWWFPASIAAGDVVATVREAGGPMLADVEVFDVYAPAGVPGPATDRVSLALRLEFRAADRTLTDEEVAQRRAKIDAAVASKLGGEPRG